MAPLMLPTTPLRIKKGKSIKKDNKLTTSNNSLVFLIKVTNIKWINDNLISIFMDSLRSQTVENNSLEHESLYDQ